jgi:hypothetical protein
MRTIARQQAGHILGLSFFLLILLFLIDGCKKDSSSPTAPGSTFPTVARNWKGNATLAPPGDCTLDVTATFAQSQDSALSGNWLWTCPSSGHQTQMWFTGKINRARQISLVDTHVVYLNWQGTGLNGYNSYAATLNDRGDTISGAYTPLLPGTFVLVKQ